MTARIYTGRSMWPTFHPGDVLEVCAVTTRLRPGDVAVFRVTELPESRNVFVHRVMAVTETGLVTRGDNNRHSDPWRIAPQAMLGVVTHYRRGDLNRRVTGGWKGWLQARLQRMLRAVALQVRRPLRVVYGRLRASGIPARLWRPRVESLRVNSPHGPIVKFLWRGRTVAQWWPRKGRFVCRKPFDLFLAHPSRESSS